jgi:serine/threonine protein kinase
MLSIGARMGAYEIVGLIGAGGMGEVYRARDATLGREVALKLLSTPFLLDADRVSRFQREAKVLAAVNHPHIGAIFGIEESGGVRALVLELVEGTTLAERIAQGPMPLSEVRHIARQICEAIGAAHQHGIIHRDLKPANIKIRPDGVVKVLDFGLAEALVPVQATRYDPAAAPTVTSSGTTHVGATMGTPRYMGPWQAIGRPADKRDDVWAFGSVFYEMLTGRRAFDDDGAGDTMTAGLVRSPDWTYLPLGLPEGIKTLVTMCLERDPHKRIGDFSIALFLLRDQAMVPPDEGIVRSTTAPCAVTPSAERRLRRGTLLLCLAVAFGIVALRAPGFAFTLTSLILAAVGAANLIYYFIVRSRLARQPESAM